MKLEDVVMLAKQGFTKDEILRFEQGNNEKDETAPASQETDAPEETEKPVIDTNSEQVKQEEKTPDKTTERLDSIEATMNKLLKAVQLQNLHNDSTGGNLRDIDRETDKIMESIIRP